MKGGFRPHKLDVRVGTTRRMIKMMRQFRRTLKFLAIGPILVVSVFAGGCAKPAPPPGLRILNGYVSKVYPTQGLASDRLWLTSAIWGPFHIRFFGTTGLEDNAHLQALVLKDGQMVDWWPDSQWLKTKDGQWEVAVNANDPGGLRGDLPSEFPRPDHGYTLRIIEANYGSISEDFDLGFPPEQAPPTTTENVTASLEGTSWSLTLLDGKKPYGSSKITLSFNGGRAVGTGGCNSYGASYQTKDRNVIGFSSLTSTLIQCSPQQINDQEQAYLKALDNAANFDLEGDRLRFYDIVMWDVSAVFERMR